MNYDARKPTVLDSLREGMLEIGEVAVAVHYSAPWKQSAPIKYQPRDHKS